MSDDEQQTPRIGAFSLASTVHDVYALTRKQGLVPDALGRVLFSSAAGGPASERARGRRVVAAVEAEEWAELEDEEVWQRGWWETATLAQLQLGWRQHDQERKAGRQAALRRKIRRMRRPRADEPAPAAVAEEDQAKAGERAEVEQAAVGGHQPPRPTVRRAARGGAPTGRGRAKTRQVAAAGLQPASTRIRRLSQIQWTEAFKQQQLRPTFAAHGVVPPIAAGKAAFGQSAEADAAAATRLFAERPDQERRRRSGRAKRRPPPPQGPCVTGHRGRAYILPPTPATDEERAAEDEQVAAMKRDWLQENQAEVPRPRFWLLQALARRRKVPAFRDSCSVTFVGACKDGNAAQAQICVRAGLPPSLRDRDGVPVLNLACRHGHCAIVALLSSNRLGMGNDYRAPEGVLEATDEVAGRGFMALHEAAAGGQLTVCQMLLGAGSTVDAFSSSRMRITPLLLAVQHNRVGVAKMLIAAGAVLSTCDARGRNVLHYAARYSAHAFVLLLLQLGMSTSSRDHGGATAADTAAAAGRSMVAAAIAKFSQLVSEDAMIDHLYSKLSIPEAERVHQ